MNTRVFLHVGTRKSGTTSLQLALQRSVAELGEQDINLLFPTREEARRQFQPVRAFIRSGDDTSVRRSMREIADRIRELPEVTHLVSLETLAELPREATELILAELSEFEVHVLVTARHWVFTLPSEWQQGVKSRLTISYPEFLSAVRDRTPAAAEFLAMQDLPAIVDRWGASLPRGRVQVIACPPRSHSGATLLELFCSVVGIDPTSLNVPQGDLNTSISLDQAELLRRINAALGDRLRLGGSGYESGVRSWIVRGSMQPRATDSIRIPSEFATWAVAAAREQYDALLATGVDIIGDAEHLLPDDEPRTGPLEVGEEAVAAAAVETLADLAHQRQQHLSHLSQRIEKLKSERNQLRREVRVLRSKERREAGHRGAGDGQPD